MKYSQNAVAAHGVRRYRARLFWLYLASAILVFGGLLALARSVPYLAFELWLTRLVQTVEFPPFALAMQAVSSLGFAPLSYAFIALPVLYLVLTGWRWEAVMAAFAAVGVSALGELLKAWVGRARPTSDLVHVFFPLQDYSFPSGHVLLYTAFLGFLWFLVHVHAPRAWQRTLGLWVLGLLIGLVGLSRVYLGQHWVSDVLAAYLLGSLWLALTIALYRRFQARFAQRQQAAPPEG